MNGTSLLLIGLVLIGGFIVYWFFIRDTINKDTTDYIELSSFMEQDGNTIVNKINYYDQIDKTMNQRVLILHNQSGFTDFEKGLWTLEKQSRITKLQYDNANIQKITKSF